MKKSILIYLLLYLLSFLASHSGYAQTIDRATWEKQTEDVSYFEKPDKKKEPEKPKEEKPETKPDYNPPSSDWINFQSPAVMYTIIGFAIILLAILLFKVIGLSMNSKNAALKKSQVTIDYENIDEHIHDVDLRSLLEINIDEGKYNIAVRLQFLEIIKKLSAMGFILWERQKTNGEYLSEVYNYSFISQLQSFARVYEYVWFGTYTLTTADFKEIEPQYNSLMNTISNYEK